MDKRITINPEICHGKPVITGTRVLVSNILVHWLQDRALKECWKIIQTSKKNI